MKLNKKGMSTIEIITSFALAFVIFIILFNVVISLKDIYVTSGLKTNVLIGQANFNRQLHSSIDSNKNISSIKLDRSTYTEDYNHYTIENNEGEKYKLIIDKENKKISLNDYVYKLSNSLEVSNTGDKYMLWDRIGEFIYTITRDGKNILVIDIPLKDKILDEEFHLKTTYQYDSSIPIQIES